MFAENSVSLSREKYLNITHSRISDRAFSATRTYKSLPEAQVHIPLGKTFDDLNYSLERKRVFNSRNIVTSEDNAKQHSHTHKVLYSSSRWYHYTFLVMGNGEWGIEQTYFFNSVNKLMTKRYKFGEC